LKSALGRRDIAQLNAVLQHRPDELTWLSEKLQVSFPGESKILMIKYEGEESPEEMVQVVDAVIEAYQNEVVAAERISKNESHRTMEGLYKNITAELKEKIERQQTLSKELGGSSSPNASAELNMLIRDMGMLQQQLVKAKEAMGNLEVNFVLQKTMAQSPSAMKAAISAEVDADPTLKGMESERYAIEQSIRQMQSTSKRPNSQVARMQAQLQSLAEQQQNYRAQLEADLMRAYKAAPNDQLQMITTEFIMRRNELNKQMTEVQEQMDQKREDIEALGSQNGELAMLEAEVEQLREIARTMDIRLQGWKIDDADSNEEIKVMQSAFPTDKINVFERFAIATVGAIAAFCGTCYGLALMEFRRRRLNSPADVDEGLGIRVLGVLPPVASRKAMAPGSLTAAQLSESIDNVRATLMHDSTSRPRQIVLVASPSSMEGSTTVASHLALSLTRAGRRTLLIDGDLRDPSLHKLFAMPLEDGVCELLRSEIEISDAIRPTNTEGLWLMTAGVCDMDAIHALATDQLQPIFEKLRAEFDFVIIDGAPILGLSDSLSIGQHIDGAILTVLRDHSGVRSIHQASELLKSLGIRVLGCVVNGMPFKADRRITRIQRHPGAKTKRLPAAETES
jgi:capsular exopolysaccharide synthesis family protein